MIPSPLFIFLSYCDHHKFTIFFFDSTNNNKRQWSLTCEKWLAISNHLCPRIYRYIYIYPPLCWLKNLATVEYCEISYPILHSQFDYSIILLISVVEIFYQLLILFYFVLFYLLHCPPFHFTPKVLITVPLGTIWTTTLSQGPMF